MKANEFIKKFGVEEAQFLIDEWDGEATNWSLETGFVFVGKSVDTHMLCIETLKRLIESHELVERFDGLDSCKLSLYYLDKNNISSFKHRFVDDLSCTTIRFKQAIADVEACQ